MVIDRNTLRDVLQTELGHECLSKSLGERGGAVKVFGNSVD